MRKHGLMDGGRSMPARFALVALMTLSALAIGTGAVSAQDGVRGAQLFTNTDGATGRPVGKCIACHADLEALREMIRNRGGRADDAA